MYISVIRGPEIPNEDVSRGVPPEDINAPGLRRRELGYVFPVGFS